jgi:hypothetical protein
MLEEFARLYPLKMARPVTPEFAHTSSNVSAAPR